MTELLADLIARAKAKGYRTIKTDSGGWLVEQTGSPLTRRPKFASRYRLGSDSDLIRLLAELAVGNKVGVGYPTTLKPPPELPQRAADRDVRVWAPPRRQAPA